MILTMPQHLQMGQKLISIDRAPIGPREPTIGLTVGKSTVSRHGTPVENNGKNDDMKEREG